MRLLLIVLLLHFAVLPADLLSDDIIRPQTDQRNVLIIAVDDLRVDLGCYGNADVHSPYIDRLASRGTLFERAYCQQAVCNPSRASLLTGKRPDSIRVWDLPTHFRDRDPDLVTLPQYFRQNGYFTQNIGKIFHNWRQDAHRGDAPSWSVPAVMHYDSHSNDRPQVDNELPPDGSGVPRTEMRDVPDSAYFDGRIAALAIEALEERARSNQPFLLAVGFWKPHAPFNAPQQYWEYYDRSDIPLPANPDPPQNVPSVALHDSREILRGFDFEWPNESQTRALRHGYYAAISYVDAQIGKVLDAVDRLELWDNTIIVFWSDHGFHLGEHHLWAKTSNFELDAHVPLLIASPEHRLQQRSESLVELIDIYPTLVDLCHLPAKADLEGKSLRPILNKPDISVKTGALTQHTRPAYPRAGTDPELMGYSLRTDHHRYTEWRKFETGEIVARELYDHQHDSRETVNLAEDPAMAELLPTLSQQLEAVVNPH